MDKKKKKVKQPTELEMKIAKIETDAMMDKMAEQYELKQEEDKKQAMIDLGKVTGKVIPVPLNTHAQIDMTAAWVEQFAYFVADITTKLGSLIHGDLVGDFKTALIKAGAITQEELDKHAEAQMTPESLLGSMEERLPLTEEHTEEVSTEDEAPVEEVSQD